MAKSYGHSMIQQLHAYHDLSVFSLKTTSPKLINQSVCVVLFFLSLLHLLNLKLVGIEKGRYRTEKGVVQCQMTQCYRIWTSVSSASSEKRQT